MTAVAHARDHLKAKRIYLVGLEKAGPWTVLARALCGDAVERCAADTNTRSRSVAERLGMRQEGVLRDGVRTPDGFRDLVIYGILEEEWRAQAR